MRIFHFIFYTLMIDRSEESVRLIEKSIFTVRDDAMRTNRLLKFEGKLN